MKARLVKESSIFKPKELNVQEKLLYALTYNNYDMFIEALENEAIPNKTQIHDYIIKYASPFKNIDDTRIYQYISNNLDIFISKGLFTPEDVMEWSAQIKSVDLLKKSLQLGAKLDYKLLSKMFKHYNLASIYHRMPEFYEYLKDNLETLISNNNIKEKDIPKIRPLLSIRELEQKSYPKGYKQYRCLKFIRDEVVTSRMEVVKLIYELNYGPGSFNPLTNASYWSTNFRDVIGQYYTKENGRLVLTNEGIRKLNDLEQKFKDIEHTLNPYR